MNTAKDHAEEYYKVLFDDKAKIDAFDKIAEAYYYANFGSESKSDLETLMFSIYIEQILKTNLDSMEKYSDYTLSKLLGITQSRISSLKERKQLQYPYEDFDWKKSFMRISKNAIFENGKIKMQIPDRNLYIEIQNAIETAGGFIEVQLNRKLLQVELTYFIDLMLALSDEADRKTIRQQLAAQAQGNIKHIDLPEYESFGKALKGRSPEIISDIISGCVPFFKGPVKSIVQNIIECMKRSR